MEESKDPLHFDGDFRPSYNKTPYNKNAALAASSANFGKKMKSGNISVSDQEEGN